MQPERLSGVLSNINKLMRRKTTSVKESDIFAISDNRANVVYNKLTKQQKKVVERLSTNLKSSKEFGVNAVIGYSIMKHYEIWDTSNLIWHRSTIFS